MRYLIDTNILFLLLKGEKDLTSRYVSDILEDPDNSIYISSESIKEALHYLQTRRTGLKPDVVIDTLIDFVLNELGFIIKYVAIEHLAMLASMPIVGDHTDPSDRLIIAQSMTEEMPLISTDTKFPQYSAVFPKFDLIFNDKSESHGGVKHRQK